MKLKTATLLAAIGAGYLTLVNVAGFILSQVNISNYRALITYNKIVTVGLVIAWVFILLFFISFLRMLSRSRNK